MTNRLADAGRAFGRTAHNRDLLRAQLAFGAANAAEQAFTVGLGVVAYAHGGAGAVAAVAVLRLVPSAVLAPLAGALADRRRREHVLAASSLGRAVPTALAAVVLATGGPLAAVYALAVLATIAATPFRAAHSALLPSLCRTTEELTSSNVVRGMLDALSLAAGPLAAAALLHVGGPWSVFAAAAVMSVAAFALVARLRYEAPPRAVATGRPRPLAEAAAGIRTIAADGGIATTVALGAVQVAVRGALTVFVVVVAIDLLVLGDAGVGLLQGAMGVGAVAGSLATGLLVGSRRMAAWFGVAVAWWGIPLVVLGVAPEEAVALAAFAAIGAANSGVDVTFFTVAGRLVPDEVLARTFGAAEALWTVAVALGALVTAPLIAGLGLQAALVVVGVTAPVAVLASGRRLARIDRELGGRQETVDLLRRVPMLRPLPAPTLEHLARSLTPLELPAGATVFAAGDHGDAFYVVAEGRVDVRDGERLTRTMGAGEGFGEIALLRDVPRTRSVLARDRVVLQVLRREVFLPVVTGYGAAAQAAAATADRWLGAAPGTARA